MRQPDVEVVNRPPDVRRCPACGDTSLEVFFEQQDIPVASNVAFGSREEAVAVPRGDLRLAFCHGCGLIANVAWEEPALAREIETSQAASAHFLEYARALARSWVERYGLAGETVLEIGCGRGEFLEVMLDEGVGHGIGVDPVLAAAGASSSTGRLTRIGARFRAEHLAQDAGARPVRAIVCRHTLEHVYDVGLFMTDLRAAIGDRAVVVLFEVPDVERVLEEAAFHDVYYEHCAYFSAGSLARLFQLSGFEVLRLERTYADQYLVIEARPAAAPAGEGLRPADDRATLWRGCRHLREEYASRLERMETLLADARARGERVAFWGAGSKATAFLTSLSVPDRVDYVVDINPRKWGTFIPGTGHEVVSPEHTVAAPPGLVVLMNPAYLQEVGRLLDDLGVTARLTGPDGDG